MIFFLNSVLAPSASAFVLFLFLLDVKKQEQKFNSAALTLWATSRHMMHFKTVAVIIAQPCYPWCICHMLTCLQPPPLLRFHVTQFGSTGSPLTCVFHSQRSAGLPYAKVTPWLWIGSTMFVLIGRLAAPPPPPATSPGPSLPPRPAARVHVRLTRAHLSQLLLHCAHVRAHVTIGSHTVRDPCTLPTI